MLEFLQIDEESRKYGRREERLKNWTHKFISSEPNKK
jgi:hypothetical protein